MLDQLYKLAGAIRQGDCLVVPTTATGKRTRPAILIRSGDGAKATTLARFVCSVAHGNPPDPLMHAAHSCHNNICIEPNHLSWKYETDNHSETPRKYPPEGEAITKVVKNGKEGWSVRFRYGGKRYHSGFLAYKHSAINYRNEKFKLLGIPIPD